MCKLKHVHPSSSPGTQYNSGRGYHEGGATGGGGGEERPKLRRKVNSNLRKLFAYRRSGGKNDAFILCPQNIATCACNGPPSCKHPKDLSCCLYGIPRYSASSLFLFLSLPLFSGARPACFVALSSLFFLSPLLFSNFFSCLCLSSSLSSKLSKENSENLGPSFFPFFPCLYHTLSLFSLFSLSLSFLLSLSLSLSLSLLSFFFFL